MIGTNKGDRPSVVFVELYHMFRPDDVITGRNMWYALTNKIVLSVFTLCLTETLLCVGKFSAFTSQITHCMFSTKLSDFALNG